MNYSVRTAIPDDLPRIQEIYAYARSYMALNGNPNQWGTSHPPTDVLWDDIEKGLLFVMEDDAGIHGVFYFYIGEDPTYHYIEDGEWASNTPYGTIHRIAGDGSGGVLAAAVAFAKQQISHIRIDTHEDNRIMQRAVTRQGFVRRGIIYLEDGDPRIAYDMVLK